MSKKHFRIEPGGRDPRSCKLSDRICYRFGDRHSLQVFQPLRVFVRSERIDKFVDIAVHDRIDLVQ